MNLKTMRCAILGLALAAGIPLSMGNARISHAAGHPLITASWKAGVLTVSGGLFTNGGAADVVVYNGYSAFGGPPASSKPAATAVTFAQQPPCSGIACIFGARIHTSFYTLNPPPCSTNPNDFNPLTEYDVVAFDEATKTVSNMYTVGAACGTGLNNHAPAPASPWITGSLNPTTGVIFMRGSSFTPGGSVDVTYFLHGEPLNSVHTTAAAPCGNMICIIPGTVFASFATGVIGCGDNVYTVLAMDEATHHLSNEVQVAYGCPQPPPR
jgi:hypothetical protein